MFPPLGLRDRTTDIIKILKVIEFFYKNTSVLMLKMNKYYSNWF